MDVALSKIESGPLSPTDGMPALSIGELERALLSRFPAQDACEWDRTGLLVGDPTGEVTGVFVALDPTIEVMQAALAAGCNVVLTHHPVYLDAPEGFLPAQVVGQTPGSRVAFALAHGLSCMNFHTALDVSVEGLSALPRMLRLECLGPLEPLGGSPSKGFVMLCAPGEQNALLRLSDLAARCVAVNKAHPRVWGDDTRPLMRIAVSGGSANSFLKLCLDQGIDCLVCGELGYHAALDAMGSGLSIIELGHDVSEMPLCAILADAVSEAGVPNSCITMVSAGYAWHTPEAYRR
ncbi:MAG: Nif3-like dinuclear metal center hexameric protein [Coriobacteriia bacterium]|nr:Nif3-like dinuclear metal center hexameric protein [Coriobacteriia bacterium]